MKAALISLESESSKWTAVAMEKYFDEVDLLNIRHIEISISGKKAEILYKGTPLARYDCIFAKGSFRYANLLKTLTLLINGTAYMPISDRAFTFAHDKLLTQLEFQRNGIPMPTTYLASTITAARSILERLNYPIIMKFPQGTGGKGVLFAESFASASSILDALSSLRQPFIIQEFLETGGRDVRAFVIGGQVTAAYQRKAKKNEARSNIHSGGTGDVIELDDETKRIAVKAAEALGADVCGVDILMTHKGPMVLEVNLSPGLQGITQYTGIDIADKIAKYLADRTQAKMNRSQKKGADKVLSVIDKADKKEDTLITSIDFRGSRVLLPEMVSKLANFKEDDDYEFVVKNSEIYIKKFEMKEYKD
ncbi:RimK family alpha-L-glutamate ligase [Candidatus Woesearchaeota archaeon]|nr:RimK family alpha-L-glutamate ligase [Candidatus Woesearchaeota archaeon]